MCSHTSLQVQGHLKLLASPGLPPATSLIRASAVHKTPELIGDNVVCCPKHTEEQKKNGMIYDQFLI